MPPISAVSVAILPDSSPAHSRRTHEREGWIDWNLAPLGRFLSLGTCIFNDHSISFENDIVGMEVEEDDGELERLPGLQLQARASPPEPRGLPSSSAPATSRLMPAWRVPLSASC